MQRDAADIRKSAQRQVGKVTQALAAKVEAMANVEARYRGDMGQLWGEYGEIYGSMDAVRQVRGTVIEVEQWCVPGPLAGISMQGMVQDMQGGLGMVWSLLGVQGGVVHCPLSGALSSMQNACRSSTPCQHA